MSRDRRGLTVSSLADHNSESRTNKSFSNVTVLKLIATFTNLKLISQILKRVILSTILLLLRLGLLNKSTKLLIRRSQMSSALHFAKTLSYFTLFTLV